MILPLACHPRFVVHLRCGTREKKKRDEKKNTLSRNSAGETTLAAIHVDSEQHSEKRAFFATLFFCLVCTSLKKHMLGLLVSAISPVSEERFRGNGRGKKGAAMLL